MTKTPPSSPALSPETLEVLYEDNHLIAVNKPAGIPVQGDRSGDPSLMDVTREYIRAKYKKPGRVFLGLVHRLDRPVSGVVLFARTSKGASRISRQWRERTVGKTYRALVHGNPDPASGSMLCHVQKEQGRVRIARAEEPGSQEAALDYRTLKRKGDHTLIEVVLHTGRKHQIRVQLAAAGWPIVGDVKYGAPFPLEDRSIRLTASSLTFKHPTLGHEITLEAPPPPWA